MYFYSNRCNLSPSEVSQKNCRVIYDANLCPICSALIIKHCLTCLCLHDISDETCEMDFVCEMIVSIAYRNHSFV